MEKQQLAANEIKINSKLRALIKSFLESDEEVPQKIFDYLSQHKDETRLYTIVQLNDRDKNKIDKMKDDDFVSLEVALRIIENEDGEMWIPVFTSEETIKAGEDKDDNDEDEEYLPLPLDSILDDEGSDDINGIVIDPWTNAFPIPNAILNMILDEEGDQEGGISLLKADITELDTDAIVNSSNNTLAPGPGGVNKDIHDAAGEGLAEELRTMHGCKTGEAKISDSYGLDCKYIIHTVGPIYSGNKKDEEYLADCYDNCLYLAREHGLHSIAFPCIATGNFGYPKEEAMDIAVQTVLMWLAENDDYEMGVVFCCKDEDDFNMYQDYLNEELGDPE